MLKKHFLKEKLSISLIGKSKFYIGICLGLFSSFIIFLLFVTTQAILIFYIIDGENKQYLQAPEDIKFYKYFFSFLATTLGLLTTQVYWFRDIRVKKAKKLLALRKSVTYSMLIFWVIFYMLSRTPFFFYLEELDISNNFTIIFYLLPIVLFLQGWNIIQSIYKTGKWIIFTLALVVLVSTTLPSIKLYPTVEYAHKLYLRKLIPQNKYIDSIVSLTEEKYTITFDNETIQILKEYNTHKSTSQVKEIYTQFKNNKAISLNNIILAKMIVHNLKGSDFLIHNPFAYPQPYHILEQIKINKIDSPETYELFELLKEEILLLNKDSFINSFERERYFLPSYYINYYGYPEIKEVVLELEQLKIYKNYLIDLPKLKPLDSIFINKYRVLDLH